MPSAAPAARLPGRPEPLGRRLHTAPRRPSAPTARRGPQRQQARPQPRGAPCVQAWAARGAHVTSASATRTTRDADIDARLLEAAGGRSGAPAVGFGYRHAGAGCNPRLRCRCGDPISYRGCGRAPGGAVALANASQTSCIAGRRARAVWRVLGGSLRMCMVLGACDSGQGGGAGRPCACLLARVPGGGASNAEGASGQGPGAARGPLLPLYRGLRYSARCLHASGQSGEGSATSGHPRPLATGRSTGPPRLQSSQYQALHCDWGAAGLRENQGGGAKGAQPGYLPLQAPHCRPVAF